MQHPKKNLTFFPPRPNILNSLHGLRRLGEEISLPNFPCNYYYLWGMR